MKKIEVLPYSKKFPKKFETVKNKICKAVGSKLDIHHIGSTAVASLGGKGIIDILIGIQNWKDGKEVAKKLRNVGFTHVHPKEKGRIFLSNKKETRFGDVHIHIVRKDTKQYRDFLNFVDYLKKHKKEREKYLEAKKKLLEKLKVNRKKYRLFKGKYIESVLCRINKK